MVKMSSSDPPNLQQQGQKLYQQGDFKAAVDAFTEALKKSPDPVAVLDSRAATYTKLTQYDLALRDARHMIKKNKNDERGYLRCAKVLLLDGKPDKALGVYAYGLKTLPSNHPRRQIVELLHKKLHDKMSAKYLDPFSVLPLEVATMVLEYFDFRQLVAILRVSKKWDQFLSSIRKLWMRLDFSSANGKVYWTSVRAYIRRSKAMLTGAVIANLATPSTAKALQLLSRCPNLEYLELRTAFGANDLYDLFKHSKRLRTLITSANVTMPLEYVPRFLATLPLIEAFEVHSTTPPPTLTLQWPSDLPNLKRITIGSQASCPNHNSLALYLPGTSDPTGFYSVSNLEELRFHWNAAARVNSFISLHRDGIPRLRRLDLSFLTLHRLDLPPSIEYLRISAATYISAPFADPNHVELPRLRALILNDLPWASLRTLEVLLEAGETPLRILHVDCCFRLTGSVLAGFVTDSNKLDSLEELNVSNCPEIDDKTMKVFITRMRDLKVLNVSYTKITGCTIKDLADFRSSADSNAIKISRIYAKFCEELSSDAVAYGRAKGIEIFI